VPAFLLPDLGEGLTEAEIVTWRVQAGDVVAVDQTVVEGKRSGRGQCRAAGTGSVLHGRPGDVLAVGAPLITQAGQILSATSHHQDGDTYQPGTWVPGVRHLFAEPGVATPDAAVMMTRATMRARGNVLIATALC
jgi:pyruvate/2-oxoglutarate dehydrogenase complex dihydrolipoamide acyltransferase (E2) component